jgi:hypothetical protein
MTIDAIIMLAGVLVAMLPFLGFPIHIDNIILPVLGIFIIALGIILRRRSAHRSAPSQPTAFVESAPHRSEAHETR